MGEGGDTSLQKGDADTVLGILRNYLQSDAVVHVHRQVVKFLRKERADQPMERYLLEFDILRRQAEKRMMTAGAVKGGNSPRELGNNPKGARKFRGRRVGSRFRERVPNGYNRRTGERNHCDATYSEYHLALKRPKREQWAPASSALSP